jgi:Protein of unknown function (DUF3179)
MAEVDVDEPSVPHVPIPTRGRSPWVKGLACVAILPLLGFIGQSGRALWDEWSFLRQDQASERASAIVGYVSINPRLSFAERPDDWYHDEGDSSLLWSGWRDNQNHWFRIGQGDVDRRRLSLPIGKDAIQAIDYPLFETKGDERWGRVQDEALVASCEDRGSARAYPLRVLDKVEVINDLFGDRPVLVVCTPVKNEVSVFEARIDGDRLTMGHSGYFLGFNPVLYDRDTESLWSERDGSMVALGGRRKGASMKRLAQLPTIAWSDWKSEHPGGKLLIGADRSRPTPTN